MSFNEKYKILKFPFWNNKLHNALSVIMILTIMFLLFFPIYIYIDHLQYKIKSEVVKWSIVALYCLNLIILSGFSAYYIHRKLNPPEKPNIKPTRVGNIIRPKLGLEPQISQPHISGLVPAEFPTDSSTESPTDSLTESDKSGPFG